DGRSVPLLDLGTRIEKAAESYRLAHDPAEALASYQLSYGLLTDALKAQLTPPDSLSGASIDDIRQAAQQMDAALAAVDTLDNTRLDQDMPAGPGPFRSVLPVPGNGAD